MSASATLSTAGWIVLLGVPSLAMVALVAGIRAGAAVALVQDASPILLLLAWPAALLAAVEGHPVLALAAAAAAAYHVVLLVRMRRRNRRPGWAASAPSLTLAVANVYVDNADFTASAAQLIAARADVVVVAETTPRFRETFDRLGGIARYPYRAFDPDDTSDYAVSLYSAHEPVSLAMVDIGELRAAVADVSVGGEVLRVVGAIPAAAVDRGGYRLWRRQVRALGRYVARVHRPLVVAGDLNTTVHRAAFSEFRSAGLRDAHDSLGLGLRPSFQLAARGTLARLGPLVRLDHALSNAGAWPLEVTDLDAAGSDHRPFVVHLAVRQPQHVGAHRFGDRHRRARRTSYGRATGGPAVADPPASG